MDRPESTLLIEPQFDEQRIKQRVVQIKSMRCPLGCDENRPGFRSVLVRQSLEVLGDGTAIRIEVTEAIYHPSGTARK